MSLSPKTVIQLIQLKLNRNTLLKHDYCLYLQLHKLKSFQEKQNVININHITKLMSCFTFISLHYNIQSLTYIKQNNIKFKTSS